MARMQAAHIISDYPARERFDCAEGVTILTSPLINICLFVCLFIAEVSRAYLVFWFGTKLWFVVFREQQSVPF